MYFSYGFTLLNHYAPHVHALTIWADKGQSNLQQINTLLNHFQSFFIINVFVLLQSYSSGLSGAGGAVTHASNCLNKMEWTVLAVGEKTLNATAEFIYQYHAPTVLHCATE